MTTTKTVRWLDVYVERRPPTKKHRPAIWENMLGTVYAMNDDGETRYFHYDHEGAIAFAGVTPDRDPRLAPKKERVRYTRYAWTEPRTGQTVLWITR